MKRDWDFVREILVKVEELSTSSSSLRESDFSEENRDLAVYHAEILLEAELVKGDISHVMGGPPSFFILRLTWEGHEFLDSIRDLDTWNKTKTTLKGKGGAMTFDLIKAATRKIILGAIGLGG